jgi:hypothetical protein
MPARRGSFSASLTPFGGGVLDLDAAYAISSLQPTPDPPTPAPPPQHPNEIPIVGTTPVPPSVLTAPAEMRAWEPSRDDGDYVPGALRRRIERG